MQFASIKIACPAFALLAGMLLAGMFLATPTALAQRRLVELTDPAVEQTMQRAQRGPSELGQAISALTRMGEFKNAEQLLKALAGQNYNEKQKLQVASGITSSQRLRLTKHPEISSASVTALDELFDLRAKDLASPSRLSNAINALLSPSPDQSLPGIRILFQGGEASTAALVQAIVNTSESNKRDTWLRAMLRIDGESGITALRRIALYGNSTIRDGAMAALIRLGGDDYMTELVTALYRVGPDSSATAAKVADVIRSRGDALPSRASVVSELRGRLDEANRVAMRSLREIGKERVWVMTTELNGVQSQRIPSWVTTFRDAADAAARLIAVGDVEPASLSRQLVAIMGYEVANDPDWGDDEQVKSIYDRYVLPASGVLGAQPSSVVVDALSVAVESGNDPASLGLIRCINTTAAPARDWLTSTGSRVSPLVVAIDHPNSIVRFEAASAIAGLAPTFTYAGSSRVHQRWVQISQLKQRGTAIILENRPEVISAWERLMNQAGLNAIFVPTARKLEVVASSGDDIRLIVSKREPKDVSAITLIDMVRRIRMTRDVPLLFYNDPIPRLNPPVTEDEQDEQDELNEKELQAAADAAATYVGPLGVVGGVESLEGVVEKELLYEDLDIDSTARRELNLEFIGKDRWEDVSLRAGLIRQFVRPRSVAGLYELLLESRRRQHLPPLSPIDRTTFRQIAQEALAVNP